MHDFFLGENTDFVPFSVQHLLVFISLVLVGFVLIYWAGRQEKKIQFTTGNIFASSICFTIILGSVINVLKPQFNYQEDLPLHLCNVLALLLPILSYTRKYVLYEIFLFLVFAGTFQSLITPTELNYLNFTFFRYWFVHAGLVIFMLYATFVYKMRPTLKSVFKSLLGMQLYTAFMFFVNYMLGSNYFFTNRKPEQATLLDFFGDWPQYVIVVEIILIPFFLLIYFPFFLARKKT